jgi:hypothetical protein
MTVQAPPRRASSSARAFSARSVSPSRVSVRTGRPYRPGERVRRGEPPGQPPGGLEDRQRVGGAALRQQQLAADVQHGQRRHGLGVRPDRDARPRERGGDLVQPPLPGQSARRSSELAGRPPPAFGVARSHKDRVAGLDESARRLAPQPFIRASDQGNSHDFSFSTAGGVVVEGVRWITGVPATGRVFPAPGWIGHSRRQGDSRPSPAPSRALPRDLLVRRCRGGRSARHGVPPRRDSVAEVFESPDFDLEP